MLCFSMYPSGVSSCVCGVRGDLDDGEATFSLWKGNGEDDRLDTPQYSELPPLEDGRERGEDMLFACGSANHHKPLLTST